MLSKDELAARLSDVRASLAGRAELVAVSKFHPADYVRLSYELGQRLFGESRVQELVAKHEALAADCPDIVWHFIGPLQTNKVKYLAPFIHMIESVTSERLLEEINRQGQRVGRRIPILLEVYVAEEETKSGFSPEELLQLVEHIHHEPEHYRGIELCGLMAMASNTEDSAQVRGEFARVAELHEQLLRSGWVDSERFAIRSMGMSGDYPLALEEGATHVRIGSALFGERH